MVVWNKLRRRDPRWRRWLPGARIDGKTAAGSGCVRCSQPAASQPVSQSVRPVETGTRNTLDRLQATGYSTAKAVTDTRPPKKSQVERGRRPVTSKTGELGPSDRP